MADNGMVKIEFDEKRLRQLQRMLDGIPNGLNKAVARGINRAASHGQTQIARNLSAQMKIKQKRIRQAIVLEKANYNRWQASVKISDTKRIPLLEFGARQTKTGVTYKIEKAGGRKKIAATEDWSGAFIATMSSGHTGVFKRAKFTKARAGADSGRRTHRGRIVELFGPSVPVAFEGAHDVARMVLSRIDEKMREEINRQADMLIERGAK